MKKNILIVEDDNIIAFELQTRLEEHNYNVVGTYAYGEDVIDIIGSLDVDLILMDINLKGKLDGIDTAEIIKKTYRKPFIYLTAYTDATTLERAKITEPFGYIIKPFEERELYTNIEMALYKHKIELELIESQQWLETTLKSIGDGVIATDINANVKFMNKIAEEMTGWSSDEAIGMKVYEIFNIISEIDRKPAKNPIERVIREGIVLGLANHTILLSRDGREIPIADTASPIKDEYGRVIGCVLVFQNHTDRRRYQRAIEESEANYRTTLESMDDSIYVVDKDLNIVLMNKTLRALGKKFGCTCNEATEGKHISILKPFVNDSIMKDIETAFSTGKPMMKEEDYSAGETILYSETKRIPILDSENNPRLVTVIRDITENKINIDELNKNKKQLQSILDFTPAIVYIKDLSGKYLSVNKKFEQVFHTNNDVAIGKDDAQLFDNDYSNILSRSDREVIDRGIVANYEESIRNQDDKLNTYIFSKFLLYDSYGEATSICAIATDITDRKNAEEEISNLNKNLEQRVIERTDQLKQANLELQMENEKRKAIQIELEDKQKQLTISLEKEKELNNLKNDFIMMISHEYRTPLTVILLASNNLSHLLNGSDKEKVGVHIDMISTSVKRMTKLLENTITLKKHNSDNFILSPEQFDIIQYITILLNEVKMTETEAHNYEFLHEVDSCLIVNDKECIHHIIGNFLSNASKFSAAHTTVTIEVNDIDADKLLVKVTDRGIGIPEAEFKKIFETFFRSGNVYSRSGFGLGLSIAKKNADLIGGEISVESKINSGTTFSIVVPKKIEIGKHSSI